MIIGKSIKTWTRVVWFLGFIFFNEVHAELDCFWNGCGYKCPEATRVLSSRSCEDGGFTLLQRQCCRERDILLVECVEGGCGWNCPDGTVLKSSSTCMDGNESSTLNECCLDGHLNYTCSVTGCGHDCPKGTKPVATFDCKDDIFDKSYQKCCLVEMGKTISATGTSLSLSSIKITWLFWYLLVLVYDNYC